MFYKEEVINGVLCWKDTPNGEWHQFSAEQLTKKLIELRIKLNAEAVSLSQHFNTPPLFNTQ